MVTEIETIAALSSGSLPSGVAVLRISGPSAFAAIGAMAGALPEARRASLRMIRDADGGILDRGLVILFPGPNSATGEDLAELHLHGGRAVVEACLAALTKMPGIRLAEAGEFTRRAFENGRIDLTEAEGLGDLLAAETEGQRRLAIAQAGGAMRRLCEDWMQRLTHARAMLEADFDFSDEDDVGEDVAADVSREIHALHMEMAAQLVAAHRGEILRHGFRVAILGAPNAGKSSLLNALAARDVAIVSDVPGTTRDRLEVALDLAGIAVRLIDTAGLRETEDTIEKLGMERALQAASEADLVLHLIPAGQQGEPLPELSPDVPVWLVASKADLAAPEEGLPLSVKSGMGVDTLIAKLSAAAQSAAGDPDAVVPARARHRDIIAQAVAVLNEIDMDAMPPEVAAEMLRMASDRLGQLVGRRGVEDLLDVIFSQFCIGK